MWGRFEFQETLGSSLLLEKASMLVALIFHVAALAKIL